MKRSSSILRECFGTIGRSALRFGFLFAALSIGAALVVAAGIAVVVAHAVVLGIVIVAIGLVLFVGISMYAAAAGMYMRTILYRYATQQPIPSLGLDIGRAFGKS